MNKKYLLLAMFSIAVLMLVTTTKVTSNIAFPKPGNCGDPVTGASCAQGGCHNGPVQTASLSTLAFMIGTGVVPSDTINLTSPTFRYTPGTLYHLRFALNSFTGAYGFQTVSLNASNAQAGVMATTAGTTQINTSVATGTRQYMGHKGAGATKSWGFNWTAPAAGTGPVTFYYAYNTANNDGDPTGDVIYKSSSTIQEATGAGIEDISTKLSDLNIYPNPISNEFSISFDLEEAETVSTQLYSLDGRMVNELLNEKVSEGNFVRGFNTNDLPTGVYLMKLSVGESSVTKKIVKQ